MNKGVEIEVAIEIISLYIAIEYKNNNLEKVENLKLEREEIYKGNISSVEKVIKEYAPEIKKIIS